MNYKSILIVTYGRSGSTLLQGLLNDIDGVIIRGENRNLFFELFKAYEALESTIQKTQASEPSHAWFGALEYDINEFLNDLSESSKKLLLAKETEELCIGFKEIRYLNMEPQVLNNYLDFLQKLFHDPAIIFNVRNHADVLKSGFWRKAKQRTAKKQLQRAEKTFLNYSEKHKNCFVINYDDVVSKTAHLKDMYEFLGAEYNEVRVDKVLGKPHSYGQSQSVLKRFR